MLPVFKKSLIIILAMLQFFAPLVHAHTGNNRFNQGLHIPGLESYHDYQNSSVSQNGNVDQDSEGLLVVVDAGIKSPQDMFVETANDYVALLPVDQLQITTLSEVDHNFSPQIQPVKHKKLPSLYSPRAPPAL